MSRAVLIGTAILLAYSAVHCFASGVRYPLADPNLGKFDEQTPPLAEFLRTGEPVHVNSPVQYGPVFFFVVHPLLRVTHGHRAALAALLYALQLACIASAFLLTCATLRRLVPPDTGTPWPLIIAWLAALWLNFTPLYTTMAVKSVETWELLLVCLALYASLRGQRWVAACAVAAAGLIKLLPFVFLYYWLLTDRRALARACVAVLVILIAGHAIYGPDMGWHYLFSRTGGTFGFSYGLTWHENVSLKAAIAKLFGHLNTPPGYWVDLTPPQLTATVVLGDLAILILGLLLTRELLRVRGPRTAARLLWEWSFLVAAMLVLSPNTTFEYATLALGATSYALVRLASSPGAASHTTWVCFGGAMLFLGTLVPRQVLHRLTFVSALNRWTGNTHLTAPEAYQYYCFPLVGLLLLGWTIWRVKPADDDAVPGAERAA